jgi:RES domain-containing protein
MVVFRMHGVSYDAFDTTGSFLQPGRWHSAGTRVIYAAEHASLAALETLIHAGGRKIPPRSITRIHIPDDLAIESRAWIEMPDSQKLGDRWVSDAKCAVLRVPSVAVNRMESNFVLNPSHPDFVRIAHDPAERFVFNPRFFLSVTSTSA